MRNDNTIRKAIDLYLQNSGINRNDLAKKLEVTHKTVRLWVNGETEEISNKHWIKLKPLILPYLPAEYRNSVLMMAREGPTVSESISKLMGETRILGSLREPPPLAEVSLIPAGGMTKVPVISYASAAGFDPVYDPFDDLITGSIGETYFSDVKPGMVAIQVEGDSMSPLLPNGSKVLVSTSEFPQRGDIVVARLKDIGIVIKKYSRKDNVISLTSINNHGSQNFKWNIKEERDFCVYIWPVVEWNVNARRQRWEAKKLNET